LVDHLKRLNITHHEVVTSTSDLAAEAARNNAPEGTAFRGDIQTRGRGRHGRDWSSPRGNLYLSVILRPDRPMAEWGSLSLMAAIALHDAMTRFRDRGRASLKWPNDILLDDRKCAGLLLEIVDGAVILGCGVNCMDAPEDVTGWMAGSLNQDAADPAISPDQLLEALEISLLARYNDWHSGGFDHLRQHWIDAAAHIGDEISLDLGQGKVMTGVFETIGSDGSLLLRGQDGGITAIQAGDVLRARPEGTETQGGKQNPEGADHAAGD
jgi:BirA family biotin operon repressor/biotin-[acetyl-CoA-carboxylase] ligase|tara:strand:+ start:7794 stop:8597 length:804 start_codon:yes stop_codon:yes gene_type:complete